MSDKLKKGDFVTFQYRIGVYGTDDIFTPETTLGIVLGYSSKTLLNIDILNNKCFGKHAKGDRDLIVGYAFNIDDETIKKISTKEAVEILRKYPRNR
jgi:hypothetical protein